MNVNGILDNFVLPGEGTAEALRSMNLQERQLEAGVTRFMGHDKGVAYRFFVLEQYNAKESKAKKYEVYDSIDMIEWRPDKYNHPVERVTLLPHELLQIDEYGEVTGKYAESYIRFKKGLGAAGTPLDRWVDKNNRLMLSTSDKAALENNSIFTVEQFAAQPKAKIDGKFSPSLKEAFERAIQFTNGAAAMAESEKMNERMAALEKQNAELMAKLAGNEAPVEAPAKKTWSRKKKVVVEDGEIKES